MCYKFIHEMSFGNKGDNLGTIWNSFFNAVSIRQLLLFHYVLAKIIVHLFVRYRKLVGKSTIYSKFTLWCPKLHAVGRTIKDLKCTSYFIVVYCSLL